ncbi:c-type cytochrome [bacterium]|nr:c-type cytochrome [bacterium]
MQILNSTQPRRRLILFCAALLVLLAVASCASNDNTGLSTPNVNVLAPTATSLVARVEVMVVVVTPTPEETNGSHTAPAPQEEAPPEESEDASGAQEESSASEEESGAGDEQQLINMGEQVYAGNCATCHGDSGEGDSLYPALNNSGLLTAQDPGSAIQIVLHGRGEMPAFADSLSSEEIAAVLSYVRTAWNNSAPAVNVEQVASVQQGNEATENGDEAEADMSDADTSDTETADTESADTESADTESADTESADTEEDDISDTDEADTTEETEASDTNDTETPDATTTSDADTAESTAAETPTPSAQESASAGPQPTWTPARHVTPLVPATQVVDAEDDAATDAPAAQATGTPSPAQDNGDTLPPLRWTPSRMVTPLLPSSIGADPEQEDAAAPESETTPQPEPEGNDTEGDDAGDDTSDSDSADSDSAGSTDEDKLALGEQIYIAECARCHQDGGEGTSLYPSLEDSEMLTAADPSAAIDIVLNGMGQMPGFGGLLNDEEIAAVLTYERNSWGNNAAEITVEQVQSVKETGRVE